MGDPIFHPILDPILAPKKPRTQNRAKFDRNLLRYFSRFIVVKAKLAVVKKSLHMKKGHNYCGWRIAAVLLATAHLLVGWLVFVPKELHRGHDITGSQA